MRRWQAGDPAAFADLVAHWQQPVVRFLARLAGPDRVPDLCQEVFLRVLQNGSRYRETGHFSTWLFQIALNYGGRAEIVDTVNRVMALLREREMADAVIDEQFFSDHLYTANIDDPDLLIRTSGELRVSNFLLWQIAYAEIHVTKTLWPDFRKPHLYEAIADYQRRQRRFGGL